MKPDLTRLLKINHLKLINAIAEHGQLVRAADVLSITQPAASRMLSEIEHLIGAPLFERRSKGMVPTLIGTAITKRSSNILLELHDLGREVDELKQGERGVASVGAVTGAAVGFVIPAVQELKEISPRAEVHINVGTSPLLVRDLIDGLNDFVLARLPPEYDPNDFEILPACTETVVLVVRDEHPLAQNSQISVSDLAAYEWVVEKRAPLREALDQAFVTAGVRAPENIVNTTSLLAMIAILVSSNAFALMAKEVSDLLIDQNLGAHLKVLPLQEQITMPPYYLLQMKGRLLSPLANHLKTAVFEQLQRRKNIINAISSEQY